MQFFQLAFAAFQVPQLALNLLFDGNVTPAYGAACFHVSLDGSFLDVDVIKGLDASAVELNRRLKEIYINYVSNGQW